jgi:hypothetical protein
MLTCSVLRDNSLRKVHVQLLTPHQYLTVCSQGILRDEISPIYLDALLQTDENDIDWGVLRPMTNMLRCTTTAEAQINYVIGHRCAVAAACHGSRFA